ncbi:uncharacterized protein METZ01_LOCUS171363 [marine metagenome]|uniref:Uncharacterized protein n=1 Tax=marine metagenome TaxID=408172 RepID=A0A382BY21_9ZZZZ
MKNTLNTIFAVAMILSAIASVGAIDGPTGYENDNWGLCFIMMGFTVVFGILTIRTQNEDN